MQNTVIKGYIQHYERTEKYDDNGLKIIVYLLKINNGAYTLTIPKKADIYFERGLEVILNVNEQNGITGILCPKKGYQWGEIQGLNNELAETDYFELVKGVVIEKRKESFLVNKGTSSSSTYLNNTRTVTNYTIVLSDKSFRVEEAIGEKIKPATTISALLKEDIGFVVKDETNNKIYGKPRQDYLIAILLWVAFNVYMLYMFNTNRQNVFVSFSSVMWIGNLFFGIAFLFSFTGFLSKRKSLKLFETMLNNKS